MIRVLVGGDVCPIQRSQRFFEMGDAAAVFTDLLEEFRSAVLRIVNLECPLIGTPSPVRRLHGQDLSSFLAQLDNLSWTVLDDDFLRREWTRFCRTHRDVLDTALSADAAQESLR